MKYFIVFVLFIASSYSSAENYLDKILSDSNYINANEATKEAIRMKYKIKLGDIANQHLVHRKWIFMGTTSMGDIYYDALSILIIDGIKVVPAYTNVTDSRRQGKPLSGFNYVKINCEKKIASITKPFYYDGFDLTGQYLGPNPNDHGDPTFDRIEPQTPIANIYSRICQ